MVDVLGVEQGKELLTVSITLPVPDIFSLVSSASNIPETDLLLFNSEGVLIDPKQELSSQTMEGSALFVLRRNNVVCAMKSATCEKDWKQFKKFPALDAYEEPFAFEGRELVDGKLAQETERLLFDLAIRARKTYAEYMMHMKRYDQVAKALEIRARACPVLLKSIKLYYKEARFQFSQVRGKLEKLKSETLTEAEYFKPRLKELQRNEHLLPYVQQLLKDSYIKNYGKQFASSLRSLETKLSEVEKVLDDAKKSLREKMNKAKNRGNTLHRFSQAYFYSEVRCKEPQLAVALQVCAAYRTLRLVLNEACKGSGTKRIDPGVISEISMCSGEFQDQVEDAEHVLTDLDEFGRQEKEEITRISVIFRDIISECADKANRLKLRVKDKLEKLDRKIAALDKNKDWLSFPRKFPDSCEAAVCEIERRKATSLYLSDMYATLCQHVIDEEERRRDFVHLHGKLLPASVFPELEVPIMSRSVLRCLLKLEDRDNPIDPSAFSQLDERSKRTVLHYEYELKQAEIQRVQDLQTLQTKCATLERDLNDLSGVLANVKGENKEMQMQIQNYSVELGLLRDETRGSQLRQFSTELERLKMKEAAFKEGWIEQVQNLEMEVRMLRSRERKKSRQDAADIV